MQFTIPFQPSALESRVAFATQCKAPPKKWALVSDLSSQTHAKTIHQEKPVKIYNKKICISSVFFLESSEMYRVNIIFFYGMWKPDLKTPTRPNTSREAMTWEKIPNCSRSKLYNFNIHIIVKTSENPIVKTNVGGGKNCMKLLVSNNCKVL